MTSQNLVAAFLCGFAFWLQITLGSLGIVLIHDLTGGRWGVLARPYLSRCLKTLYLLALVYALIFLSANSLYSGASASPLTSRPLLAIRSALYFVTWIAIARGFLKRLAQGR